MKMKMEEKAWNDKMKLNEISFSFFFFYEIIFFDNEKKSIKFSFYSLNESNIYTINGKKDDKNEFFPLNNNILQFFFSLEFLKWTNKTLLSYIMFDKIMIKIFESLNQWLDERLI